TEDARAVDRDVRHAEVVSELILPGVTMEEAIEILIAGMKRAAIVARTKGPNLHRASGRAAQVMLPAPRRGGASLRRSSSTRRSADGRCTPQVARRAPEGDAGGPARRDA